MFKHNHAVANYKLRVAVLECPYDTFTSSDFTRDFLTSIFKLKFEGYRKHYPYGIMPVSEYDFMATHVSICLEDGERLLPLAAFKSITNVVCDKFRVAFPVVSHKFGSFKDDFPTHVEALNLWQQGCEDRQETYAYNASWTMRTDLDKDLRGICRELTYALLHFHYNHQKIQNMINSTACTHNVNINEEFMGLKYLKDKNGNFLEPFSSPVFYEQPFQLMYFDKSGLSDIFVQDCKKYQPLWDSRLVLNSKMLEQKKKIA